MYQVLSHAYYSYYGFEGRPLLISGLWLCLGTLSTRKRRNHNYARIMQFKGILNTGTARFQPYEQTLNPLKRRTNPVFYFLTSSIYVRSYGIHNFQGEHAHEKHPIQISPVSQPYILPQKH